MIKYLNKYTTLFNNRLNKKRLYNTLKLDYNNINIPNENIYSKKKYNMDKGRVFLNDYILSVLGYGSQGRAQALNLTDRNCNVIVGVRRNGPSWNNAINDGFIPDKTLFDIDEAVNKGSIIMNLLSDAGQMKTFDILKDNLKDGDTLYFSHGFNIVYSNLTKFDITKLPKIDIIMVAPKGSGQTVRSKYIKNEGINSSFAIYQNYTGYALKKTLSIGFLIGSPYMYKTTFEKEVYSDLTGERSILMGGIAGLFKAQYDVLRENGHSPSEAFNETVEEALQSLYPLINDKGMDYMFSACSTTAQRGALDWSKRFEDLNKPLIEEIYNKVKDGTEVKRVLDCNLKDNYRESLDKELNEINNQEIWNVGKIIRKLR
tara:strand:- start:582 stop:1700 length:1119 start_codon:yes stop_codon:yes gene_type:complete